MALESKAFFSARLAKLGLAEDEEAFKGLGWTTMGEFGFATNYRPMAENDAPFINDVIVKLYGDADHPRKAIVRRLYFEAFSAAAADVNRRTTMPDEDDKPKKLPLAEKEARWASVKEKLVGLELEGELEPAEALVDKFVQMEESGQLRYLKWEEYTRRNQEFRGIKKEEMWKEDPNTGVLKRIHQNSEVYIDLSGDKLQMRFALQRRGLAMELANILSFSVHERLINRYFLEMSREQIPGYGKVSVDQIRLADKEVFERLAEHSRKGFDSLETDPTLNQLPLDQILPKVMDETRIVTLLMPLPGFAKQVVQKPDSSNSSNKRQQQTIEGLQAEVKRLKASGGKGDKGGGGKAGGKGDKGGKGKHEKHDKNRWKNVPQELIGMSTVADGKPICFSYNMRQGCSVSGESRCEKGEHRCAFPGCQGEHSLTKCPLKKY
jgi:hypothetical protein